MQDNKTVGLGSALKYNETVQLNSELLNILKSAIPRLGYTDKEIIHLKSIQGKNWRIIGLGRR
jgi:hypothetical protein